MIVQVEEIEPGLYVLASLAEFTNAFGKELESFGVAVRRAFAVVGASLLDLRRRAFIRAMLFNPR